LETYHLDNVLSGIKERIDEFRASDLKSEVQERLVEYIDKISVVASDPFKAEIKPMVEVSDLGRSLLDPDEVQKARQYFNQQERWPAIWRNYLKTGKHPPYLFTSISFVNFFSPEVIILFDIYRPPWKSYFTSDVFFYQWLKSLERPAELMQVPTRFPSTLYIHNITNIDSKSVLRKLLDQQNTDCEVITDEADGVTGILNTTPHLKLTHRILDTYNMINQLRGEKQVSISAIQIYRDRQLYHAKITVKS
jgi:hypothetical protein